MRVLPYGDDAWLVELPADEVLGLHGALVSDPRFRSVVPAARTVLVEFDAGRITAAQARAVIDRAVPEASPTASQQPVTIEVDYDGPDLAEVAAVTGLSTTHLVELHADREYTVQFCGFTAGFGYLTGLDPRLRVPRLASPRPQVPAGAVALADSYTGVYPHGTPGGWRLIGHTDATLFDLDRDPPALLRPGVRVRFARR